MESRTKRQKALLAEYRNQAKKMGAYCIFNTENKKRFIGTSRDIEARLNRHRFALKTNTEQLSPDLQADWNLQGADVFEFTVLDTIEPPENPEYNPSEDLLVLEQLWLEQLKPFAPNGYN